MYRFKKTGAPIGTPVFLLRDGNLFRLAQRAYGDGALVGLGQDAVLAEEALAGAASTGCCVVKVQGNIASTLQLVLIDGLGKVIGSTVICVEVEVLVHAELQTLS